jgi:hypothetical protein
MSSIIVHRRFENTVRVRGKPIGATCPSSKRSEDKTDLDALMIFFECPFRGLYEKKSHRSQDLNACFGRPKEGKKPFSLRFVISSNATPSICHAAIPDELTSRRISKFQRLIQASLVLKAR